MAHHEKDQTVRASQILAPVRDAGTFEEARHALNAILGLRGPASTGATARVLADPKFALYLTSTRMFPQWRDKLLEDPANQLFAEALAELPLAQEAPSRHIASLARKAAVSLAKWTASGFATVEPWLLQHRLAACAGCDQNVEAPASLLYQISLKLDQSDDRVCNACGCFLRKKASMPFETCPLSATDDATLSRWGDPLVAKD